MSDRREGAATHAAASQLPPQAAPMFTDAQLRRLKAAVIIMGVVLILGFGVVIFRIIHLLGRAGPPATPAPAATALSGPRPDLSLELPEGAVVRQTSLAGDRLLVHFEAAGGGGVAIVDLATGRVQRVRFGRDGQGR